jgi:DNA-binding MarR family transcriptional regulator
VAIEEAVTEAGAERLGFLLARHGAITNIRIREALSVTGLSARQSMTLWHLAQSGSVSQQALIEILGFDPSVLVAILNELELRGFAARRRDPADRRRHIVAITPAGTEALCEVDRHVGEVERQLFADLDENEIENLHRLLARIRTSPHDPACTQA